MPVINKKKITEEEIQKIKDLYEDYPSKNTWDEERIQEFWRLLPYISKQTINDLFDLDIDLNLYH